MGKSGFEDILDSLPYLTPTLKENVKTYSERYVAGYVTILNSVDATTALVVLTLGMFGIGLMKSIGKMPHLGSKKVGLSVWSTLYD